MGSAARAAAAAAPTSPSSSRRATNATRSSDQIATDLRRVLVGLAGTTITTRASGGNQQLTRAARRRQPGQPPRRRDPRRRPAPSRAGSPDCARRAARRRRASPTRRSAAKRAGRSWRSASTGPKAALLGLSVSGVANTIRTNISGTQAAFFRERGKEFPIIVRLREEDRDRIESVNDVLISTPQGLVLPGAQRARPAAADRARRRSSARTSSGSCA